MESKLAGIILSGGQSSRMGRDKGLMPSISGAWAKSTMEKMSAVTSLILISVNAHQINDYLKQFREDQLLVDDHTLDIKGPLTGLMTAHEVFKYYDIIVLPCDLPNMSEDVLKHLQFIYETNPAFDAWVFRNDDQIEPVCGIYGREALARILKAIKTKNLGRFSMHHVLELLTVYYIPVKEEWKTCFENFNTHTDLDRLK